MDRDRVGRAWAAIRSHAARDATPVGTRHVCEACLQAVGAAAVGVSLIGSTSIGEPVCAVGATADELMELQFTLGEGPCVDAVRDPGPVLVTDLASAGSQRRWPMFAPAATGWGARAVFALPLQAGTIRVGVLEVYRSHPGALSGEELADALVYADAAMLLVLGTSEGIATDRTLVAGDGFDERRAEVHQAAGMISVQLGMGVDEALTRLRAHAYAEDRRLADVARDVVARRLRFAPEPAGNSTGDDHDGPGKEARS